MRTKALGGTLAALVALTLVAGVASAVPTPTPDVVYFHMDEPAWNLGGADVFDTASQTYVGWAQNGVATVPDGKFGRAGSFDGVNDYFDYGGPVPANITLEAWIKPKDVGHWADAAPPGQEWRYQGSIIAKPGAYYLDITPQSGLLASYF